IAQPSVAGTYGTFTLAANGVWTYTANNAQTTIQQLGAGQTLTDSFTATSADGSASQTVTVTIQGTNDVPVIAGVSTGTVTEDTALTSGNLTKSGTLTIADVDAGQSSFIAQPSVAGTYGTFTLAANGVWTYTADNAQTAIQQLGAGQTLTDSFTAKSLDGTATQLVTVTIQGTNDVPVIAGVSTGTVTEDVNVTSGNLTSSGTLTIADVDAGQSSFIAQPSVAGTYGTFTLAANGVWTYTANNAQTAIQQLKVGQSLTDSFTAKSFDGTATKVVTVTIQGTNEVPILTNDTKTGNEDTIITGNVLSNDQDSDGGVLTVTAFSINNTSYAAGATATIAGVGTLSIGANGAYSFTPVANWSGSAPSITYTVSDGQGGSATASLQLNVTAVADVPTLGLTTPTSSIPIGTGLIKETWINNILGLTTNGAGATPSTLQAVIEATLLNPSSTTSIQNVQQPGTNDVATGTASKISGLIYLEAGHTYTFSGSGDDSIRIVVGNNVVAQATWGGSQGVFSGNFVPTTTGYYLLSIYHNNSDGPGNYDVNLRDNGGAIKDLSSANFKLYQDVDDVHGVNLRLSELKPDGFYQAYSYNEGSEDTSIPLSRINAALVDTDGSEILAIKLGNIPVGAVLSDGTHTFTSTVGNTSVDITGWNINALTILPPLNFNGNFSLQVTATATETSNGAQESSTVNINVTVYPVDDVPVANIADGITQNIAGAQIDGVLADMGGESQGGVINLNGTPLEGLTSGRVDITYNISGSTITAMAGSNVVFVLSADGPDGTYNFTLLQPLDPINIAYTPTVSGSGNASAYYVNSASGALSASAGDWEMKITASGGNGNVILNSNGLGVTGGAGNTVVNRGEKLTFDFDNTGLDGVANNATGMTLDLIATGSVDVSYKWTAYYTDGTTATGTAILPDGTTASIDIPVTANKYLDRVELENNSSSSSANNKHFRVSGVEFDIEGDKTTDLPFQFTATDGDGDSISGNFTVTVTSDPLNLNLFDFSNEHEKVLSNNSENLLIPEDLSHMGTVAGGHGIDTVKFNENNMGLSTNEIKEHFGHGGWEVIDMAGAGKNDVHLDLDAALKLAHNSDLSVEVNGVTYDHVLKIRGDGDGQQHDTVNIEKTSTQTWNELGNVDAAHGGGKLFEFSNGAEVAHVQVVGVTPTAALPEIPPPTTVA
uniref:VCBS domain-containing protein n=1 Tax=Legionella donaldsonii TaxID=45060 RepID=UPI00399C7F82